MLNFYISTLFLRFANPLRALTLPSTGGFWTDFQSALRGGKTIFLIFFIGASAKKRFARSKIFGYGLPQDILSKKAKSKGGRDVQPVL